MITITLPQDLEAWAREEVAAGRAQSVDGLIAESLRLHRDVLDEHKRLVQEAYLQKENGEVVDEAEMDAIIDGWFGEETRG